MWFRVVLWAVLWAVTDGSPVDEATELTVCPLTTAVLALKVTDPSETCVWLKDTIVLFDNRDASYSSKRNKSHEYLIIPFVSEKDSGTYVCQIRPSYKHGVTYKLLVRSQDECNSRQDNNSANNFYVTKFDAILAAVYDTKKAVILAAVFSILAAAFGGCLIYYLNFYPKQQKKIRKKCHTLEKDSYKVSSTTVQDECATLSKATSSDGLGTPVQVLDE